MDLSAALFLYFSLAIALSLFSLSLFLCAVLYLCGRQINENLQKDEVAISEARGHEPLRLLCLLRLLIGLGAVKFSAACSFSSSTVDPVLPMLKAFAAVAYTQRSAPH